MHQIYFADKGHTRKRKCSPLWPVKDNVFHTTPKAFWEDSGLVLYVDAKEVNEAFFIAHFSLYDPLKVEYRPRWDGNGETMIGGPVMHASYIRGELTISTKVFNMLTAEPEHLKRAWYVRHEGLRLLEEGLSLFSHYFPKQK